MPNPSNSGYARLPATDRPTSPPQSTTPAPATPTPKNNVIHLSATAQHVDALFRTWTRTIAEKVNRKKNTKKRRSGVNRLDDDEEIKVMVSVFEGWKKDDQLAGSGKGKGKEAVELDVRERTLDHEDPMTRDTFDGLVRRVETAIEVGVHPRLNSKGSSGSYFARDARGTTLGIFKPKDEEPYGRLNPKFTKWIHRVFLSRVIPFGRACLIPQLSYASEAAAAILDRRLDAHIVPRTEVVKLSSSAFFYDWVDRDRFKKGKARLPEKIGSFQVFLKGFQDASLFLRNHPYPGRPLAETLDTSPHRQKRINLLAPFKCLCGRAEAEEEDDSGWGWGGEDGGEFSNHDEARDRFQWTEETMVSFREELEKLVLLDVLMRNTDRGLDNFMLKVCNCNAPPSPSPRLFTPKTSAPTPQSPMSEVRSPSSLSSATIVPPSSSASASTPHNQKPHMHIAAIDNSLAFPHQHPRGWRSFTYGWLFLPISLIGQPFSQKTRDHYLPLLSSPAWWAETTKELRELFEVDDDFREVDWNKQLAVLKGQGWNIVQSLKDPEEGPLELCRREKKLVVQDIVEVSDDKLTQSLIASTSAPIPGPSPSSPPSSPRPLSRPIPRSSPVPLRRVSSDHRPRESSSSTVTSSSRNHHHAQARSFSSVLSGTFIPEDLQAGSITGVSLMQQLDRMEKAAAGRKSFGGIGNGNANKGFRDRREEEEGFLNEEGEDDDEDEEESDGRGSWGVKSEGDLRQLPTPKRDRRNGYVHSRGAHSVELDRGSSSLGLLEGRNRSGSLTNSLGGGRKTRPMGRHSLSELGVEGRRSANWLEDFEEREEEEATQGRTKRKLVVIERLESVKDKAYFEW